MSSQYTMASICFVWFVLCLCLVGAYRYQPAVYYLSDHCEDLSVTSLTKDVRLLMNRFPDTPLQYNWRCAMVFKTEPGNRLRVTYRNLNTTWSTGCVHNSVKIFDTITQRGLNGKNGDCGVHPLNTTYSSYEYLITVMVETDNYTQYGQFDILVTSFKTSSNDTCTRNEFLCKNNRCISIHLWCNGFNDCSDDSDELNCSLQ